MREIISVSLSPEKKQQIAERAKKANKTISAYMLYAAELEQNLISEEEILKKGKKAKQDHKNGKTKKLKSLSDLM